MGADEVVTHLHILLAQGESHAASLHVLHAARHIRSRSQAANISTVVRNVRSEWRTTGQWPLALAWVAYRAWDEQLLKTVLDDADPSDLPVFRAVMAWFRDDFRDMDVQAQRGLKVSDPLERVVAHRMLALAACSLGRQDWEEVTLTAVGVATGRDRGLALTDYAEALYCRGREAEARSARLQSTHEFQGDVVMLVTQLTLLTVLCLRLHEWGEAEQHIRRAQSIEHRLDVTYHRTGLLVQLGLIALNHGEFARALQFQTRAKELATTTLNQVIVSRHAIATLLLMGRRDDALALSYEAAAALDVLNAGSHTILLWVAMTRMMIGDNAGAWQMVDRVQPVTGDDDFHLRLVRAELRRREGCVEAARDEIASVPDEALRGWEFLMWLFPDLCAVRGIEIRPIPQWRIKISLDGPIRVWTHGEPLDLRPTRPAAGLLALLSVSGGQISRERALDALDLPGRTPQARRKSLSAAVADLREALGWPGAVLVSGGVISLGEEPLWDAPKLPIPARADHLCEGRYDPWVLDWRLERSSLSNADMISTSQ